LFYGFNDDASELELFSLLAKKANVIFDIGFNTGLFSIVSGINNKPTYEPYTINFKRLGRTIELNELRSILLNVLLDQKMVH
jgi:hypothetical protein